MSEREASEDSRPDCPKCGMEAAARLAPSDGFHRWQCRNMDCLHQWNTPRERSTPRLDAVLSDRRHPTEAEVLRMAESALICGKCDRRFVHPKRKSNHEEKCKGAKGSPARAPRRSSPPLNPPSSPEIGFSSSSTGLIQVISEVPEHLQGSPLGEAVDHLLKQRDAKHRELQELNQAIQTLARQTVGAEA